MASRGVHFALTSEEEKSLLAAAGNDEAVINIVQEEIEERWDKEWLQETDKAWYAIHLCLADDVDADSPRYKCVFGGRDLYSGDDYTISYKSADEVREIAAAVASIDESMLRESFFKPRDAAEAYPTSEDHFQYTLEWFQNLQAFFAKAAGARRAVVFTVDH